MSVLSALGESGKSGRWLLAELIVLVVGILIAISVDAWRQDLQDRETEQVLLRALAVEFANNEERLNEQFRFYELRTAAAKTLLELGPDLMKLEPESRNEHWRWITRGGTYDPYTGVLSAAMASGEYSVIRDPNLRSALASWSGRRASLADVEAIVNHLLHNQLTPWMRERTVLPSGKFGELSMPYVRGEPDFELLSSSVVIENYLREIVAWGKTLQTERALVEQTTEQIQAGIKQSLAE